MGACPVGAQAAVVGDQEDRARVVGEGLFQVLDQGRGQVVGGLVQQEDVAGAAQQACQGEALALARGQVGDPGGEAVRGEQAEGQEGFRVVVRVAGQAAGEGMEDRLPRSAGGGFLREVADASAAGDVTGVGGELTGQDGEQGALASAVRARDQQALARFDGEVGGGEAAGDGDTRCFQDGALQAAAFGGGRECEAQWLGGFGTGSASRRRRRSSALRIRPATDCWTRPPARS